MKLSRQQRKRIGENGVNKLQVIYSDFKEKFEDDIQYKLTDEEFIPLILNAQCYPYLNTRDASTDIKDLFFKSKFRLPDAALRLHGGIPNSLNENKQTGVDKAEFMKKGWSISKGYFDNDFLDSIKKDLEGFKYYVPRLVGDRRISRNDVVNKSVQELGSSIFSSTLTDRVIDEDSALGKVICDKNISDTVSMLLGTPAYLVGSVSLYAKKKDEGQLPDEWKNAAYDWHFDFSHLRFIKVFIFLSDIPDQGYGPHGFVEASHGSDLVYPQSEAYFKTFKRYPAGFIEGRVKDEWIYENYPEENIKNFLGKAGDMLFEDTSGYHRGGKCSSGDRDILQLLFAISNFGYFTPDRQFQIELKNEISSDSYLSPVAKSYREIQLQARPKAKVIDSVKRKVGKVKNLLLQ